MQNNSMQIYLARDKVQAGPYSLDELNKMLNNGEVIASDLMWHFGMETWRTVGEQTGGQGFYNPPQSHNPPPNTQTPTGGFGDNVDFKKDDNRRVSVAELYGQKPVQTDEQTSTNRPQWGKKVEQNQSSSDGEWQGRHRTQGYGVNDTQGEIALASVASRFLATMINGLLFIGAFFPFLQAFMALNPDPAKMNAGDMTQRIAYAQELSAKIPPSVAMMTLFFLSALVFIQSALIIKNGQSLGKLMVGIKIVDAKTHQKPNTGTLFGVRGILLFLLYWLASAFGINFILLIVNYLMASFNKDKQGWHDKMAGTLVVKTKSNSHKR